MSNKVINKYTNNLQVTEKNDLKEGVDFETNFVISFLSLRRLIGALGIALPLSLLVSSFINNHNILPSISHYYYSSVRILFTGLLFLISAFLYTYIGESRKEKYLNRFASILAALIAIFPTKNDINPVNKEYHYCYKDFEGFLCLSISKPEWVGIMHIVVAVLFFIILTYLIGCIFIENENKLPSPSATNICIYKICSIIMLLSIIGMFFCKIFNIQNTNFPPTFFGEFLLLLAFGFSWLVKGEGLSVLR